MADEVLSLKPPFFNLVYIRHLVETHNIYYASAQSVYTVFFNTFNVERPFIHKATSLNELNHLLFYICTLQSF